MIHQYCRGTMNHKILLLFDKDLTDFGMNIRAKIIFGIKIKSKTHE